ncbi:O-glucosyltransferase rumi homolog isoform X2 [Cucumis sativus]|uniref:O-glucosyltransferase rumi homolog isoform X2 n=1 Tax=Cucumis sativus TaxID=3659 RepID=UPI0012F5292F|nr:O-glucosyltransferase rumi homolog isoform X2 [Cucumis sativus]
MQRFPISTSIFPPSRRPIWELSLRKRSAAVAVPAAAIFFLAAVLISSTRLQFTLFHTNFLGNQTEKIPKKSIKYYPLNCSSSSTTNQTQHFTCRKDYPTLYEPESIGPSGRSVCPEYFRWIHEDLKPWAAGGITREMVEKGKATAHFRLAVVRGIVYVEHYKKSIQTRDLFTIWGILQLLRRYPGQIPDLELMFDCDDRPVVKSADYRNAGVDTVEAPPVFRYCGDEETLDIVFPDWSFWGWAEINIRPWENLLKELKKGNEKRKWMKREAFAYWKGNPYVADTRQDLLKCNLSLQNDWNARLYIQDWIQESQQGYKQSKLANQCTYRYKIYIEGYGCRSLEPLHHYWPLSDDHKCKSIKFAVHWGNSHKQKAQDIGKTASNFIQQELRMENVYDYMFHLLNHYAKLLRFQPEIPTGAMEVCSETMACPRDGPEKKFMKESMVKTPSLTIPCSMPPPFDTPSLQRLYRRNANLISQVEKWENHFWIQN